MTEPGRDADLAQESLASQSDGDLRSQHLDSNAAIVAGIDGQIDGGHAAATEPSTGVPRRGWTKAPSRSPNRAPATPAGST